MTPVSHSHFISQSLSLLPHLECQMLLVGETLGELWNCGWGLAPHPKLYVSIDLPGPVRLAVAGCCS